MDKIINRNVNAVERVCYGKNGAKCIIFLLFIVFFLVGLSIYLKGVSLNHERRANKLYVRYDQHMKASDDLLGMNKRLTESVNQLNEELRRVKGDLKQADIFVEKHIQTVDLLDRNVVSLSQCQSDLKDRDDNIDAMKSEINKLLEENNDLEMEADEKFRAYEDDKKETEKQLTMVGVELTEMKSGVQEVIARYNKLWSKCAIMRDELDQVKQREEMHSSEVEIVTSDPMGATQSEYGRSLGGVSSETHVVNEVGLETQDDIAGHNMLMGVGGYNNEPEIDLDVERSNKMIPQAILEPEKPVLEMNIPQSILEPEKPVLEMNIPEREETDDIYNDAVIMELKNEQEIANESSEENAEPLYNLDNDADNIYKPTSGYIDVTEEVHNNEFYFNVPQPPNDDLNCVNCDGNDMEMQPAGGPSDVVAVMVDSTDMPLLNDPMSDLKLPEFADFDGEVDENSEEFHEFDDVPEVSNSQEDSLVEEIPQRIADDFPSMIKDFLHDTEFDVEQ